MSDFTSSPKNLLSCCQVINSRGYSKQVFFCFATVFYFDRNIIETLARKTNTNVRELFDDNRIHLTSQSVLWWPTIVSVQEILDYISTNPLFIPVDDPMVFLKDLYTNTSPSKVSNILQCMYFKTDSFRLDRLQQLTPNSYVRIFNIIRRMLGN